MQAAFFPHPVFAWTFVAVLIAILAIAANHDLRNKTIPKWITIPTFCLGILVNIARGAWLGVEGSGVWIFSEPNLWLGMLDGFLFSVVGFLATFAIFFVMWMIQICGGGDVKLFTAVGAWIGIVYALYLLAVTIVVMFVLIVCRMIIVMLSEGYRKASQSRKTAMTYALPLAISAVILLPYVFRVELKLTEPTVQKSIADQPTL